jgi:hypothetical protein
MHGDVECKGNIQQLCAAHYWNGKEDGEKVDEEGEQGKKGVARRTERQAERWEDWWNVRSPSSRLHAFSVLTFSIITSTFHFFDCLFPVSQPSVHPMPELRPLGDRFGLESEGMRWSCSSRYARFPPSFSPLHFPLPPFLRCSSSLSHGSIGSRARILTLLTTQTGPITPFQPASTRTSVAPSSSRPCARLTSWT